MSTINFLNFLKNKWLKNKFVCVGLDSQYDRIPEKVRKNATKKEAILNFNKQIIDATQDLVCAYKLQYAFYGALGQEGISALIQTISYIHQKYPDIPVIVDAKRNDIGNTASQYAIEVFDVYQADAITTNPYLGYDGILPFLERKNKGVIVLCRTSNPSAKDFQDWTIDHPQPGQVPLYQVIAHQATTKWNQNKNCCLVVGATYPKEASQIRKIAPDLPFLIPGIGKQGGDVKKAVDASKDKNNAGMIINSSRGIIFASEGDNFISAARQATEKLDNEIKTCL